MNNTDRLELRSFESDVRQLLKAFRDIKSELTAVRAELQSKDAVIERLESELRSSRRAYSTLKTARMLEVSDTDLKESKLRITRLVREVNKCIRLLSAETIVSENENMRRLEDETIDSADENLIVEDEMIEEQAEEKDDVKVEKKVEEKDDMKVDDSGMRSLFGD